MDSVHQSRILEPFIHTLGGLRLVMTRVRSSATMDIINRKDPYKSTFD